MLRLQAKIEAEALPMALLLQVHDELVFEVQRDRVEELEAVIRVEMERVDQLPIDFLVPLKVDIGVGEHWLDAH
jgi:DNA polymerase-1